MSFFNIYLFIWLHSVLNEARQIVQLWHVGSSSLTGEQTQAPCIGSRVLATGPPGKSPFLGKISCCPHFFQWFKPLGCPWSPIDRYKPGSHPWLITIIILFGTQIWSPKVLVHYDPLCPPHCSIPQMAHFIILIDHRRTEPLTLTLPSIMVKWTWFSNQRNSPDTKVFIITVTCIIQKVINVHGRNPFREHNSSDIRNQISFRGWSENKWNMKRSLKNLLSLNCLFNKNIPWCSL